MSNGINVPDYYKRFNIRYDASKSEIKERLDILEKTSNEELNKEIQIAKLYMIENQEGYLRTLKNKYRDLRKEKQEIENNKKRKFKLVTSVVMAGFLFISGGFVGGKIVSAENEDLTYNVCVECEVESGQTYEDYEEVKDKGFVHREVPYEQRNQEYLYAGDIIVGRTTKEKADELVEQGVARIISIEEAIELLGENNSYKGEFKKYIEGKSDFVFYVPITKQIL